MTRLPKPAETFTLIDSITYTWHDEYVIDAEGPLTVTQVLLTDEILTLVDSALCAYGDDCPQMIGVELQGDRNESWIFHAFYVSDRRAICCECAHTKSVPLAN